MSLPSSESLPNNFDDLPISRQRHIRRRPQAASHVERTMLLDSLQRLTLPTPNLFLLSILGSLTLGAGLYFDDPIILLAGAVLFRFVDPLFGLALLPTALKRHAGIKSLISLLILTLLAFSGGVLSGYLNKTACLNSIPAARFSTPFWIDISIVCAVSVLGGIIFVRSGKMPRLIGVLLTYEILVPIAAGGFGFPIGNPLLWPQGALTDLSHLFIAIASISLIFLILGIHPKRTMGWVLELVVLAIAAGSLFSNFLLAKQTPVISQAPPPTVTATLEPSPTRSPNGALALSPTSTSTTQPFTTTPKPSSTPTITPTASRTQTPQPTSYWAVIDSLDGAVIRESPRFDAPVVGYLDNAMSVEILEEIMAEGSSIWYRVRIQEGTTGWLLGSLANSQTPIPIEE